MARHASSATDTRASAKRIRMVSARRIRPVGGVVPGRGMARVSVAGWRFAGSMGKRRTGGRRLVVQPRKRGPDGMVRRVRRRDLGSRSSDWLEAASERAFWPVPVRPVVVPRAVCPGRGVFRVRRVLVSRRVGSVCSLRSRLGMSVFLDRRDPDKIRTWPSVPNRSLTSSRIRVQSVPLGPPAFATDCTQRHAFAASGNAGDSWRRTGQAL